jgi:hypothetical protein
MVNHGSPPGTLISRLLPEPAFQLGRSRAEVDLHTGYRPLTKPDLIARLQGKQGLVRVVANVAVGYNNIEVLPRC